MIIAKVCVDVEGAILAINQLDPREKDWLSRWAYDGQTQQEIADEHDCSQTLVSHVLRRAMKQLANAGIAVDLLKEQAAHSAVARTVNVPTDALDRLCTAAEGDIIAGRWIDRDAAAVLGLARA